jgi:glycoprotein 6-alpha-L-fucosyltransferase
MNPPNCSEEKYLRCHGEYNCGWGCQMSGYVNCFSVAFGMGRVLDFYKTPKQYYEPDEYQRFYEPVTNCSAAQLQSKVVNWPDSENSTIIHTPRYTRHFKPRIKFDLLTIPTELAPQIHKVFEEPSAWWSSEINKFLFKPKPRVQRMFAQAKRILKYQKPIVAVHIRRGNKITETPYTPVDLYMDHVNGFYDQLELTQKVDKRRIFLLTDEPKVIEEIRANYTNYEVIVNEKVAKNASNYQQLGLTAKGIMIDVHLASLSDYFVCTLSSNIGRRIYEFMYHQNIDAHANMFSLDNRYFEYGENRQRFRVLIGHTVLGSEELAAVPGDILEMYGWYLHVFDLQGSMPMKNLNSSKTGWFPSFKAEKIIDVTEFPDYGIF